MDSEINAFQPAIPTSDEFLWLLHRHRVLISQLCLVSKDFGDLSGLPLDHVAAGLVVQEVSAELRALHDKLKNWYECWRNEPQEDAAIAAELATPRPPRVSLVLKGYAPYQKVNVIRVIRETVPECTLARAKSLVERQLPTLIAGGLTLEEAKAIRQKFEATGAVCRISVMAA